MSAYTFEEFWLDYTKFEEGRTMRPPFLSVEEHAAAYGVPTGTNSFAQKFATAQTIASQIESNLVPISSITNHLPADMKLQVEGDKQ